MAVDGPSWNTGVQFVPSFSVFHKPPEAEATYIVYDLPFGATTAISMHRPLTFFGPRNCHFKSLNFEAAFISTCFA
jgi:hypothetical protein